MKSYKDLFDKNGKYILDENYTEILRLDKMLTDANIPHTLERFMDGWQIIYYTNGERIADAIQHYGSYGVEENRLEIMGLLTPEEAEHDSVLGHLTAENVFERMNRHYKKYLVENSIALQTFEKIREKLQDMDKFNSYADETRALYYIDLQAWLEEIQVEMFCKPPKAEN